jgi:hypothetical protein
MAVTRQLVEEGLEKRIDESGVGDNGQGLMGFGSFPQVAGHANRPLHTGRSTFRTSMPPPLLGDPIGQTVRWEGRPDLLSGAPRRAIHGEHVLVNVDPDLGRQVEGLRQGKRRLECAPHRAAAESVDATFDEADALLITSEILSKQQRLTPAELCQTWVEYEVISAFL